MIHRLYSSLDSFKTLRLNPGLNILLADVKQSEQREKTRNRAGKSSAVELIHFLLGGNVAKSSALRAEELSGAHFGLELDVGSGIVAVERMAGDSPARVFIPDEQARRWPVGIGSLTHPDWHEIKIADWRDVLGGEWFGLTEDIKRPTFREVFPYFARREAEGGLDTPNKYFHKQGIGSQQLLVSFLLGLDWRLCVEWQEIRDRESSLKKLQRMIKEGEFKELVGDASALRAELALANNRLESAQRGLKSFQVHEQYEAYEVEANRLTEDLAGLANQDFADRRLVTQLEAALVEEQIPDSSRVRRLYSEASVVLGETICRRLDEVEEFHATITRNRRLYLRGEIQSANERIATRSAHIGTLDRRRADVMRILTQYGALEQFSLLQSDAARTESKVANLAQQLRNAEQLDRDQIELDLERGHLQLQLAEDLAERTAIVDRATVLFSTLSGRLYDRPGTLRVKDTKNGPEFEMKIHGDRSAGVRHMKVFCFDMLTAVMAVERDFGPGFLVHDSHLFDGVDSTQVHSALTIGSELAVESGFQYIVTMNSDVFASANTNGDLSAYVLPVRLTDEGETGGLFGLRFD